MSDALVRAAVEIFGPYNYRDTDPAKRVRKPVHERLKDPVYRERVESATSRALMAMESAEADPTNHHRWGTDEVRRAGSAVLRESDDRGRKVEYEIASVATSELDPDWVLQARPEEIMAVAGIIKSCRDLSRMEMRLDIQAMNAE